MTEQAAVDHISSDVRNQEGIKQKNTSKLKINSHTSKKATIKTKPLEAEDEPFKRVQ